MTVSITALELAAAQTWRAPDEARLGEWLLRAADGFTSRANSVLAIGDPGLPLPAAIDQVLRWYRSRGLPAQVSRSPTRPDRQDGHPIDAFLAGRGWTVRGGALVMTAPLAEIAGLLDPDGRLASTCSTNPTTAGWTATGGTKSCRRRSRARYSCRPHGRRSARSGRSARPSSIGRVAIADGWAGLTAIRVDPQHRRQGLARLMTAALAKTAASRGADGLYLQVETGNAAARALYERMGFTYHHAYHFRLAPDGGAGQV